MIPEECKYFEICDAPICPLNPDKESLIWYPDEAICKNPEFFELQFIKTQKKISRIKKKKGVEGVFTYRMLNCNLLVRSGIKGIDEDLSIEEFEASENAWIQKHKGVSEKTLEKKKSQLLEINERVRP